MNFEFFGIISRGKSVIFQNSVYMAWMAIVD